MTNLTTAKWTIEDYHQMIATGILDDRKVELLKGEIIEMSPEGIPHSYFSSEAGEYLINLLGNRAKVLIGKPITLPNQSEPEPDITIAQRLGKEYLDHHPYPENIFWVIEYSNSSLEKDLQIKPQIYGEAGIPEYWVIDLKQKQLTVFRHPTPNGYQSQFRQQEENISPVCFPDLNIAINALI